MSIRPSFPDPDPDSSVIMQVWCHAEILSFRDAVRQKQGCCNAWLLSCSCAVMQGYCHEYTPWCRLPLSFMTVVMQNCTTEQNSGQQIVELWLSCTLSSCRYVTMKGQFHSGMLSGRSRNVVTLGCCHEVVLSRRVTVMNRHYMMQAAVIHECCHAGLGHLTEQGCCNVKLLSCRVTIMNRRNHAGCCHSWVLSCRIAPPNRTKRWVDSKYMGEGSVGRTAVSSRPQFISLSKYGL